MTTEQTPDAALSDSVASKVAAGLVNTGSIFATWALALGILAILGRVVLLLLVRFRPRNATALTP